MYHVYSDRCKLVKTAKEAEALRLEMVLSGEKGRHIAQEFMSCSKMGYDQSCDKSLTVIYYEDGVLVITD